MEKIFNDDKNSYLCCKYNTKNILNLHTIYFANIKDAYKFINNNYDIKLKDFLESYNIYTHFQKNDFPKNYVFSFEYENNLYELYKIEYNCNYVLILFNIETNLIGYVGSFNNYDDAECKMINEYNIVFDDDKIFYDKNTCLSKHNDTLFGMIFKNIKY